MYREEGAGEFRLETAARRENHSLAGTPWAQEATSAGKGAGCPERKGGGYFWVVGGGLAAGEPPSSPRHIYVEGEPGRLWLSRGAIKLGLPYQRG